MDVGQRRIEADVSAVEEEHRDQRLGTVKAEGSPGDHSQLVVDPFGEAVGESTLHVGEDAVETLADRSRGLDERFQLRS